MAPSPLSYEYRRDDYYCYPDSSVLKNELDIKDEEELTKAEREITSPRTAKLDSEPLGGELNFDYGYVKRIHKYLFEGIIAKSIKKKQYFTITFRALFI